jgi:hypothetical protein
MSGAANFKKKYLHHAHGRQQPNLARSQHCPLRQYGLTGGDVVPDRPYVLALGGRLPSRCGGAKFSIK